MDVKGAAPVRTGRAVADDGVHLHWRAIGTGPVLLCNNGVGVSTFFWSYFTERFADRYTVVLWDYRGHGQSDALSDPTGGDVGVARHTRDMLAVMDAAGIERAVVCGHSMGCQVGLEGWRHHADRIGGYVLILGTAGRALETFADNPRSPFFFKLAGKLVARLGERTHAVARPILRSRVAWLFTRRAKLVDPLYTDKDDFAPYLEHLAALDLRMFIRTVNAMQQHDAWDLLPSVSVPVLIVGAERDAFTPIRLSKNMAAAIPGAELLVLADASHAAIIEQPETINHRVERFLHERQPFAAP
ncbi:MAG: alpha/beta hydrolase [Myxococcales bacterium]|nr:alpha/beta hydrolase [Myxococcales bacterium]